MYCCGMFIIFFFFFFQAEDGIGDLTVTGVQTCALPIWQQGVYIGAVIDGASAPARWGKLMYTADTNGGTVEARVYQDSASTPPTFGSMTAINAGDLIFPSATPLRYLFVAFRLTGGTAGISANEVRSAEVAEYTAEWWVGTPGTATYPAAARVFDDQYYLSFQTPTGTTNDRVVMMNKQGAWTIWDLALNDFAISANTFFGGSATAGRVHYLNTGFDDNGTAIQAFVKTRSVLASTSWKLFKRIYALADVATGSNNTWTIRPLAWPAQEYSITLATQAPDTAYSGTNLEAAKGLGSPYKFNTATGDTGSRGLIQASSVAMDQRTNNRAPFFQALIFNNSANAATLRFHRMDVEYQERGTVHGAT